MEEAALNMTTSVIDVDRHRYPHCIVWTPLPLLSWFFPVIGHMGICTSSGIIRDFAGPYYVSEDDMAFGSPTMYWQLTPNKANSYEWDDAVRQASEEYSHRMHNLCCDNCHSHVARALNLMRYNGSTSWNMYKVWFLMLVYGKYTNCKGRLRTWLPFSIVMVIVLIIIGLCVGIPQAFLQG